MRIGRLLACGALLLGATPLAAQETYRQWAATRYEVSLFDDATDPWHYASVEAGARRARLTSIVRGNWASRFDADGIQLEADLYPIWPGVGYASFSGGWSSGLPFPDLRLAGELYVTLPAAFEASAGAVFMLVDDDDVPVLVGSLSKYGGNYWFSARPSYATGAGDVALTLLARRYLSTPEEFVTMRLFGGSTPEEISRGNANPETFGVQADAQIEVSPRVLVLPQISAIRDELPGGGDYRMRYSIGFGGMLRF